MRCQARHVYSCAQFVLDRGDPGTQRNSHWISGCLDIDVPRGAKRGICGGAAGVPRPAPLRGAGLAVLAFRGAVRPGLEGGGVLCLFSVRASLSSRFVDRAGKGRPWSSVGRRPAWSGRLAAAVREASRVVSLGRAALRPVLGVAQAAAAARGRPCVGWRFRVPAVLADKQGVCHTGDCGSATTQQTGIVVVEPHWLSVRLVECRGGCVSRPQSR